MKNQGLRHSDKILIENATQHIPNTPQYNSANLPNWPKHLEFLEKSSCWVSIVHAFYY